MRISDWSSDVCSADLNSSGTRPGSDVERGWNLLHRTITPGNNKVDRRGKNEIQIRLTQPVDTQAFGTADKIGDTVRSEEHTSELQSLMRSSYAVFCLKKKKTTTTYITQYI